MCIYRWFVLIYINTKRRDSSVKRVSYFSSLLILILLSFSLSACSSGTDNALNTGFTGDSGTSGITMVDSIVNLDLPGQPIRVGDWIQINGTGFGASRQGESVHGYAAFSDGNTVTKATQYGQWSDTLVQCQVPQGAPIKAVQPRESVSIYVMKADSNDGGSSYSSNANPTPNPSPQFSPPSPSPSPTESYDGGGADVTEVKVTSPRECIGHLKAPTGTAGQPGFTAGGAEEEQFSAFLVYSNGQQVDVTENVTWSAVKWGSGDAATSGAIDADGIKGKFKADKDVKYLETVNIKAAYGELSGSKRLVVGAVEVPAITEAHHEAVDLRIGMVEKYEDGVLMKQIDAFYIGQYEVTNRDFCEFLNDMRSQGFDNLSEAGDEQTPLSRWWWPFNDTRYNGIIDNGDDAETRYTVRPGFDARPVVYVTWYGAAAYCNWLTEKQSLGADQCCYGGYAEDGSLRWGASGANYKPANNGWRLATEVEWIYACRINKSDGSLAKTAYFWGNTLSNTVPDTGWDYLWFIGNTGNESAGFDHKEVGLKLPNGLGLYDMSGNAGEWVSDWIGVEFPYDDFPGGFNNKNPKGYKDFNPALEKERILGGGCFRTDGALCGLEGRAFDYANIAFLTKGFRIVRTK